MANRAHGAMTTARIIESDVMDGLRQLEDQSVHTCVTSPPYWGLRDYGTATWEGGDSDCDHEPDRKSPSSTLEGGKSTQGNAKIFRDCPKCGATRIDDQIGLESTPEEYVAKLVEVFREVRRVLRDDGTVWLNLGDSYASDSKGSGGQSDKQDSNAGSRYAPVKLSHGLKPKDLCGIPWRVAFALQADGWWLRSDIIWHKPNPMPESVTDRPTSAHEYIFLLSKSARYFYDAEAIAERLAPASVSRLSQDVDAQTGSTRDVGKTNGNMKAVAKVRKTDKQRGHSRRHAGFNDRWDSMTKAEQQSLGANKRDVWTVATQPFPGPHFAVFPPKLIEPCILAGSPMGGTVLDPFSGSGTTGIVATKHGRSYVGVELNPEYAEMSRRRIESTTMNLFAPCKS